MPAAASVSSAGAAPSATGLASAGAAAATPAGATAATPAGAGTAAVAAVSGPAAMSGNVAPSAAAGAASAGAPAVATTPDVATAPVGPSGIVTDPVTGELVFRTDPIELPAGKESYTCFAATLEEDAVIDGFSKSSQAFVHHIQFNRTLWPEPDGLSECDVLFKLTWLPIFLAGNGASELRLDEGVGHTLPAGTQLLVQLHLLNTSERSVRQAVEIKMHRSASANPTPVSPWAIGSSQIDLAPKQPGQAQNVCTVTDAVELVAVFPHMHMLGKQLTVEVGKSLDAMKPLYVRDPYDFDDQHMEKMRISLQAGDLLRVTCNYLNTNDKAAMFGESSHDEMCFFVGFALGDAPAQADCPNLWDALFQL